jgi:hydrogenase nickel incorporation protein HypA/HybF
LAEGAKLSIENVPVRFWCAACLSDFCSPNLSAECPTCHQFSRELRAGRELELAALEVESA